MGTKTLQLAELMDRRGVLVAVDLSAERLDAHHVGPALGLHELALAGQLTGPGAAPGAGLVRRLPRRAAAVHVARVGGLQLLARMRQRARHHAAVPGGDRLLEAVTRGLGRAQRADRQLVVRLLLADHRLSLIHI